MKTHLSAYKLFRAALLAFVLVIMACASAAFAEAFAGGGIDFSIGSGYVNPASVTVYCTDEDNHGSIGVPPHHAANDLGNGTWELTIRPDEWEYYVNEYNKALKEKDPENYIEHFVDEASLPQEDVVIKYVHNCTPNNRGITIRLTRAASCTEDGLVTIQCHECLRVWTEVIPAGHDEDQVERTGKYLDPTCVAPGWTEYHCKKCDSDFRVEIPINENAHSRVLNEEKSYPRTCTEYGAEYYDCELCGKEDVYTATLYPLDHRYKVKDQEKSFAATCTEPGCNYYNCPDCGEVIEVQQRALGHSISYSVKQHHHYFGDTVPYELYCIRCKEYVPSGEVDSYYYTSSYYKCPACKDPTCTDPQYVTGGIPDDPTEDPADKDADPQSANKIEVENEDGAEPQVQLHSLVDTSTAMMANTSAVIASADTGDAASARIAAGGDDIHVSDAPFGVIRNFGRLPSGTTVKYGFGMLNDKNLEGQEWVKPINDSGDLGHRAVWEGSGGELKLPVMSCNYQVEWINADTDETIKKVGRSDKSKDEIAEVRDDDKVLEGYTYLPGHKDEARNQAEVLSGTVSEDSMLVLKLYFKSDNEPDAPDAPTYTVRWVREDPDGGDPIVLKTSEPREDVKAGDTANVTEDDKLFTQDGYVVDLEKTGEWSKTVAADSSTVLVLYMKKSETPLYTVHWVDVANGRELKEPEVRNDREVGDLAQVTESDKAVTFAGYKFRSDLDQEWSEIITKNGEVHLYLYYGAEGGGNPGGGNPGGGNPGGGGGNNGGGGDGGETIPDPDVPLTDLPEENPPLTDIPEEEPPLEDIPDEETPLSGVPETGDISALWTVMALLTGAGLVWMVLDSKKRKEDA